MDLPDRWKKSDKNLRAIQLAFEFNEMIARIIREQANEQGLSASDQIRSIIGLEAKKPKRPRLTVSLSETDYEQLAKRYNLSPADKSGIRKAIAEELIAYSELKTET
jgi:hypothetical protein